MTKQSSRGLTRPDEGVPLKEAVNRAARINSTASLLFHTAVAERMGLSVTAEKALDLLLRTGPLTAGQLAQHLGLATASVTNLIDRLEQRGYAQRVRDGQDRRRVTVVLVEAQVKSQQHMFDELETQFLDLLDSYSTEQQTLIYDYLIRSAAVLETAKAHLHESKD